MKFGTFVEFSTLLGGKKLILKTLYETQLVGGTTSGYRVYSQARRAEELHSELPRNHSSMWST